MYNPVEKAYELVYEAINDSEKEKTLDLEDVLGYLGEALS